MSTQRPQPVPSPYSPQGQVNKKVSLDPVNFRRKSRLNKCTQKSAFAVDPTFTGVSDEVAAVAAPLLQIHKPKKYMKQHQSVVDEKNRGKVEVIQKNIGRIENQVKKHLGCD